MGQAAKVILLLLVASCCTFVSPISITLDRGIALGQNGGASSDYWDMLVLTQFWPPAGCYLMESEHKGCNISSVSSSWMIHGLWPTKTDTKGPNYCNESAHFDAKILQVLEPRLERNWPSIEKGSPAETLWSHEWVKHGTCATSLPALKDEVHYFNGTLDLHGRFNLFQALMKGNITPSETKSYQLKDVLTALSDKFGSQPYITCVRDKSDKCYMEQIELCLTKSFQPTDCPYSARASTGGASLRFQSEKTIGGKRESETCYCGDGDIYYKPMPSK